MKKQSDEFLFIEKYRPQKISECILPIELKNTFSGYVTNNNVPHLLLSGSAGTGKTTIAKALANELGADLLYVNCSNENGVDTVRNKIIQFASTASFDGNLKIVLGDEFDYMSNNAQATLRAVMEEFSKTTRFILTCNFKNRISEPIHSRCSFFDFKIPSNEKSALMAQMYKRVVEILGIEQIEYDRNALAGLVQRYFPDFRKTLNEIQRYSTNGKIDSGILVSASTEYDELVTAMKTKKFGDVRKWIAKNSDVDANILFRYFYDNIATLFVGQSIPNIILILAQYQSYSAIVIDQEINNIACMVEIMGVAEWK